MLRETTLRKFTGPSAGSYDPAAHKKGADPAEWPAALRVQEFPRSPLELKK